MADYFTHLSFVVECTKEEADLLDEAADQFNERVEAAYAADEAPPEPTSPIAKVILNHAADSGGLGTNFTYQENEGHVWICDDDGTPDVGGLALLLQAWVSAINCAAPIHFTWAATCSKPRLDAFGGGACVITPKRIYWTNVHDWMDKQLAKLAKKKALKEAA